MHELDLDRLFIRSQHTLTDNDIQLLAVEKVPCLYVGKVEASILRGGLWERRFQGDPIFITPAYSPSDGSICDLIGFRLETPKIFWRYTGQGSALGWDHIIQSDYSQQAIYLHQNPIEFLRKGYGACILDFKNIWAGVFGQASSVLVEDRAFGERLKTLLERPFNPPPVKVRT